MAKDPSSLPIYQTVPTTDHDQNVKVSNQKVLCYSKKQLDKLYPEGNYTLVGETRASKKKALSGHLRLGQELMGVSAPMSHSRLLTKCVGYARVGATEFVALRVSRIPFLIALICCLVAMSGTAAVVATSVLNPPEPTGPVVITPDHPMPEKDANSEANADDDSQKADREDGKSSLSMEYQLEAKLDLNTGEIQMYIKNPNSSTHDMSVILYVVSGETEVAIAQSGRVAAGYTLKQMELVEGTAALSEGVYTGYYLLSLFDPETGERAMIQPKISGVQLVVNRPAADKS